MELIWSRMKIYDKYNGIILVNFGIVASTLICKIIICTVTKVFFYIKLDEILNPPLLTASSGNCYHSNLPAQFHKQ